MLTVNSKNNKNSRFYAFTLVELLVAMGVFSILMVALISFFNSAQKVLTSTTRKTQMYENARIALDLIAGDLECALFCDIDDLKGIYPFYHEADDRINFMTMTELRPENTYSSICEIKYARSNDSFHEYGLKGDLNQGNKIDPGWLVRSVTADNLVDTNNTTDKFKNVYNYHLYPKTLVTGGFITDADRCKAIWGIIPTTTLASSAPFEKVIPYVVSLKFICKDEDGYDMTVDYSLSGKSKDYDFTTIAPTKFPYSITIELTLLDRDSWQKWEQMGGDTDPTNDTSTAWGSKTLEDFRKERERKYTRTIYLGNKIN